MTTYTTEHAILNSTVMVDGVAYSAVKAANGDAPAFEVNGVPFAVMPDSEYRVVFGPAATEAELLPINPVDDFWIIPVRDLAGNWYQVYIDESEVERPYLND